MGFVNLTPFAAQPLLLSDEDGADLFTFILKATYAIVPGQRGQSLALADEQAPVRMAPEFYGEPGESSIKYESEAAPFKLATDVALLGHAYGRKARAGHVDVSLRAGPLAQVVRVYGDRVWERTLRRWTKSRPAPFEKIPLMYERAFGGWDRSHSDEAKHAYEPRNPVGVGFVAKKHGKVEEGSALPNLEHPRVAIKSPKDAPQPVGFGYLGHHWEPRVRYAGTYDRAWERERMPLLPKDFDPRYYNAAPPSLTARGYFEGGEIVEIDNAWAHGLLRFQLPVARPVATVRMKNGGTTRLGMNLDTVVINTDEDRVYLVWRGSVRIHKQIYQMLWAKTQLQERAA